MRRAVWRATVAAAAAASALLVLAVLGARHQLGGARRAQEEEIYESELVVEAPPPSLAGRSSRFEDARGVYERLCFGAAAPSANGAPCVNVLFTRKGFLRSGDLHKARQVNHIVSGSVRLTQRIGDADATSVHHGAETIVLPAHTPHLYEFLEDTLMTEHWIDEMGRPAEFRAWLFQPYRLRISNASLLRSEMLPAV